MGLLVTGELVLSDIWIGYSCYYISFSIPTSNKATFFGTKKKKSIQAIVTYDPGLSLAVKYGLGLLVAEVSFRGPGIYCQNKPVFYTLLPTGIQM